MIKTGYLLKYFMNSVLMTALMPVQILGISDLEEEVKNLNALNAFKCT